ncbi:MAG: hypothetical protein JWN30_279, partial [Bacilli bacterium]|nr:hypothetical protein [Bacilli bacterium]
MFRIKWVPTFVAMLLALGVLFGGYSLYQTFGLLHPLQKEL